MGRSDQETGVLVGWDILGKDTALPVITGLSTHLVPPNDAELQVLNWPRGYRRIRPKSGSSAPMRHGTTFPSYNPATISDKVAGDIKHHEVGKYA